MPPIIGKDGFHILEHAEALKKFHLSFGNALGQWGLVEERLSYWFEDATGLPYEMARAIFFAPRTFQGRTDLLEAAIEHGQHLKAESRKFIAAATKKAGKLSSFRNSLAHGEQTFDARSGSPTHKQVILISGRHHPLAAADNAVTLLKLERATTNFRELARLLFDMSEFQHDVKDAETADASLKALARLPDQADRPLPPSNGA